MDVEIWVPKKKTSPMLRDSSGGKKLEVFTKKKVVSQTAEVFWNLGPHYMYKWVTGFVSLVYLTSKMSIVHKCMNCEHLRPDVVVYWSPNWCVVFPPHQSWKTNGLGVVVGGGLVDAMSMFLAYTDNKIPGVVLLPHWLCMEIGVPQKKQVRCCDT